MEQLGPLIDVYLREGLEFETDLALNFVAAQLGVETDSFRRFLNGDTAVRLTASQLRNFQERFGDSSTRKLISPYAELRAA